MADFQNRILDFISEINLGSISVNRIIYHLLRFYIQLHDDKEYRIAYHQLIESLKD